MAPFDWKKANSRQALGEFLALPPPGEDVGREDRAPHEVLEAASRQLATVGQVSTPNKTAPNVGDSPNKQPVAAIPPQWAGPPIHVSQTIHNVVGRGQPETEYSSGLFQPSGPYEASRKPAETTPISFVGAMPIALTLLCVLAALILVSCLFYMARHFWQAWRRQSVSVAPSSSGDESSGGVPHTGRMEPVDESPLYASTRRGSSSGSATPEELFSAEQDLVKQHVSLMAAAKRVDSLRLSLAASEADRSALAEDCMTHCGGHSLWSDLPPTRKPDGPKDEL